MPSTVGMDRYYMCIHFNILLRYFIVYISISAGFILYSTVEEILHCSMYILYMMCFQKLMCFSCFLFPGCNLKIFNMFVNLFGNDSEWIDGHGWIWNHDGSWQMKMDQWKFWVIFIGMLFLFFSIPLYPISNAARI